VVAAERQQSGGGGVGTIGRCCSATTLRDSDEGVDDTFVTATKALRLRRQWLRWLALLAAAHGSQQGNGAGGERASQSAGSRRSTQRMHRAGLHQAEMSHGSSAFNPAI
jgi:hypothetical protein